MKLCLKKIAFVIVAVPMLAPFGCNAKTAADIQSDAKCIVSNLPTIEQVSTIPGKVAAAILACPSADVALITDLIDSFEKGNVDPASSSLKLAPRPSSSASAR